MLDVGCGAGLALVLAARRGALVSGLDVSPGLLGVARALLPEADLRDGDMESLPFPTPPSTRWSASTPSSSRATRGLALREAARVTRPGGRVVASLFAAPGRRKRRARTRSGTPSAPSSPGFRRRSRAL